MKTSSTRSICAIASRVVYPDPDAVHQLVMAGQESLKDDDPAQPQDQPQDREMALQIDQYDFAVQVTREDGLLVARKCVG
ncbi:hypothetical protein NKDENANG_01216 [Candidatus Entotheonellaceae bacterium PAL068K]